jgi:hypothetical protein
MKIIYLILISMVLIGASHAAPTKFNNISANYITLNNDPVDDDHAATKEYVDDHIGGSMNYPSAGIGISNGTAWTSSLSAGTTGAYVDWNSSSGGSSVGSRPRISGTARCYKFDADLDGTDDAGDKAICQAPNGTTLKIIAASPGNNKIVLQYALDTFQNVQAEGIWHVSSGLTMRLGQIFSGTGIYDNKLDSRGFRLYLDTDAVDLITINVSHVILRDMQLTGPGAGGTSKGVYITFSVNAEIENVGISSFKYGCRINDGTVMSLDHVYAVGNWIGFYILSTDMIKISNTVSEYNTYEGISIDGSHLTELDNVWLEGNPTAFYGASATELTILNSFFVTYNHTGLELYECSGVTAIGNTFDHGGWGENTFREFNFVRVDRSRFFGNHHNNVSGWTISDCDDLKIEASNLYVSENGGVDTISSGQSTKNVAHGLGYAPTTEQILLTPREDWHNHTIFLSSWDATNIQVGCTGVAPEDLTFSWKVIPRQNWPAL